MKIVLLLALIYLAYSALDYTRVNITDPNAKCLDGSQSVYYYSQGDPSKVLIFLAGGGWCGDNTVSSTLENCYMRSKTDLGSSTKYPSSMTFSSGILSDDKDNYFNNWTRIYLTYCDGSGHQGSRKQPILYKGAQLFFRGQDIKEAQFKIINQNHFIFQNALQHLVLTGESAGGLGAFLWTNYIAERVDKGTKFWSIPDSGVFIDDYNTITKQNSYRIWFQNLMKFSNEQTKTPVQGCNEMYPDQLWKCMFAQYLHPFMKAPVFAPQSLYDSWSLYNILGIRCVTNGNSLASCNKTQLATIEQYHKNTMQVLFEISGKNENAVWAPVCINHCYLTNPNYSSRNYRVPLNSDFSLIYSVKQWIEGADDTSRHLDFGDWPSNAACSGLQNIDIEI